MPASRRTRYARAHDMDRWKTDDRIAARGCTHPWDSVVADGNGEDFFLDVLDQHLTPESDVLDVGCGHGDLTLTIGRQARSVVGIERNADLLELAGELLRESGLTNVRFVQAELAGAVPDDHHPGGPLPLPEDSVDLVVDRRGPPLSRYLDDLRRVARPGTVIVGMHPAGTAPAPPWADRVPSLRHRFTSAEFELAARWVTGPLARHGVTSYRLWWTDVPEYLYSAGALYDRLADDTVPPWDAVAAEVTRAFEESQTGGAVVLRHIRLVWTVELP